MKRILCLVLLCCLWAGSAAAEVQLVPQLSQWDETMPVDVLLSVDVRSHMPFDDARCGQLNALLSHLSLYMQTGSGVSRVALLVDGQEALWIAQRDGERGAETQVSWAEGTFAGDMGTLLGGTEEAISLDFSHATWLDEGVTFLEQLAESLDAYKKETSVKTTINGMGTARTKAVYTVPKGEVEAVAQAFGACGVEGLAFKGQQKLILWRGADGGILRAEYAGQCGTDESSLRQVSLVWRMCREENRTKDAITLKTPAVSGSDYNTLTCTRQVQQDETGTTSYALSYSYTVRASGEKSIWAGEIDLVGTPEEACTRLTGSVELSETPADTGTKSTLVLVPNLLVGETAGAPFVSGVLTVQEKSGKNTLEDADVCIQLAGGAYLMWTETQAATISQETLLAGMPTALVRHLVLLPAEDTLYLSAGLPEEAWQSIVDAAQAALIKEETP